MTADAQNPGAKGSGSDRSEGAGPPGDPALLQELSRKLLDLWQDHLSAVAQDPNLLAQALKLMTAAPFAWMPGFSPEGGPGFAQSPNPFQPGSFGGSFAQPAAAAAKPTPSKAGTAAAAAAPAAGADDVEQLRRRLAELEGRLAQLESAKPKSAGRAGVAGTAKPGAGKPRRRTAKS